MSNSETLRNCEWLCSLACPNRNRRESGVEEFLLFLSPSDVYKFCTAQCRDDFVNHSMPKCCTSPTCSNTFCVYCHKSADINSDERDDDDSSSSRISFSLISFMFYLPGQDDANATAESKLIYNVLYFHCSDECDLSMNLALKRLFQARCVDGKEKKDSSATTISSSCSVSSSRALVARSLQCEICGFLDAREQFSIRTQNNKKHTIPFCAASCLFSECRRLTTKGQVYCVCCAKKVGSDYCILRREGLARATCVSCFENDRVCHVCGKPDHLFTCKTCEKTKYCSKECQKSDWTKHKEICRRPTGGHRASPAKKDSTKRQEVPQTDTNEVD